MTDPEFHRLRRGDGIWVRFGSKGRQYAIVYGSSPHRTLVLKWRAVSKTWTGRVKLHPSDFLYRSEIGGSTDRERPKDVAPVPADIWSGKR